MLYTFHDQLGTGLTIDAFPWPGSIPLLFLRGPASSFP